MIFTPRYESEDSVGDTKIASAILIYEGGKRAKSQEQQARISEILEDVRKIEDYQQKYLKKEEKSKISKKFAAQDAIRIPCVLVYSSMYDLKKFLLTPKLERLSDYDERVSYAREQINSNLKELQNVTNQYANFLSSQAITSMNGLISIYKEDLLINHLDMFKEIMDEGLTSMDMHPLQPINDDN